MQVNGTEVVHFDVWKVPVLSGDTHEYLIFQETEGGHGIGHFRLNRLTLNMNYPGRVTLEFMDDFLSINDAVQAAHHDAQI